MALLDELEKWGEVEVRKRLANGDFGYPGTLTVDHVQEWLRLKELERENSLNTQRRIAEKENLRIQRQIRNMTIAVLIITAFTLLAAAIPNIEKFFKPFLPASDIQPHQDHNQPTGHNEGKQNPLDGGEIVKPANHK